MDENQIEYDAAMKKEKDSDSDSDGSDGWGDHESSDDDGWDETTPIELEKKDTGGLSGPYEGPNLLEKVKKRLVEKLKICKAEGKPPNFKFSNPLLKGLFGQKEEGQEQLTQENLDWFWVKFTTDYYITDQIEDLLPHEKMAIDSAVTNGQPSFEALQAKYLIKATVIEEYAQSKHPWGQQIPFDKSDAK